MGPKLSRDPKDYGKKPGFSAQGNERRIGIQTILLGSNKLFMLLSNKVIEVL